MAEVWFGVGEGRGRCYEVFNEDEYTVWTVLDLTPTKTAYKEAAKL